MAFIKAGFQVGDRVRITKDIEVLKGTFTKGHEFIIESIGERGPDLIDDNGERLIEMGICINSIERI